MKDIDANFPSWEVEVCGVVMNPDYLFSGYEGDSVSYRTLEFSEGSGLFEIHSYPADIVVGFSVEMNQETFDKIRERCFMEYSFVPIRELCSPDTNVVINYVLVRGSTIQTALEQASA